MTSRLSGTSGSISFLYGVIVTWNNIGWVISFKYLEYSENFGARAQTNVLFSIKKKGSFSTSNFLKRKHFIMDFQLIVERNSRIYKLVLHQDYVRLHQSNLEQPIREIIYSQYK